MFKVQLAYETRRFAASNILVSLCELQSIAVEMLKHLNLRMYAWLDTTAELVANACLKVDLAIQNGEFAENLGETMTTISEHSPQNTFEIRLGVGLWDRGRYWHLDGRNLISIEDMGLAQPASVLKKFLWDPNVRRQASDEVADGS